MRFLHTCIGACLLAFVAGCATTHKPVYHDVTYDYDVTVDFTRIKTYNWVKMPATSRIDDFNQIRIKDVTDAHLSAKGLAIKIKDPDVYLVMYGGSFKAVDMTVGMDYDVYDIGRLKLAMYDAESYQEIWWGESRADLFFEMTPDQKDEVVENSVRRILFFYPPGSTPDPPKKN